MFWNKKVEVNTDSEQIDKILNRGTIVNVLPKKEEFRDKLLSGERLTFYIGADPTSTSLHLSHAKNYMLLEDFRSLGHKVVLLFGDFTARIGDPTDENTSRTQLAPEDVSKNVAKWMKQVKPLLRFDDSLNPPNVLYNSSWLGKLTFEDVLRVAANFTVQHMLERDMFERRIKKGDPVYLHEFLYPLMQGYDSVALDTDVEIGGTDQTFNMLVGRTLLKKLKNKEKYIVVVHLLENPTTGELMSKSRGTGVFLDASAKEMYGAIMAQPDEMTKLLLINNTRISLKEINALEQDLSPKALKMRTAREIVSIFHGAPEAKHSEKYFVETFSEKRVPHDVPKVIVASGTGLGDILISERVVDSKSDFRRLVTQGALHDLEKGVSIDDPQIKVTQSMTLKVGKKKFIHLEVKR